MPRQSAESLATASSGSIDAELRAVLDYRPACDADRVIWIRLREFVRAKGTTRLTTWTELAIVLDIGESAARRAADRLTRIRLLAMDRPHTADGRRLRDRSVILEVLAPAPALPPEV